MSAKTEERVTTWELLRESGISPVDLKNWVARGLLPPCCGRYIKAGGGCVCYYPAWAVELARDIKRLRSQGVSGERIRKILRGEEVEP
ncbi:unnamed protein product [marine sediment metagenome]|uniref:HTH merR-type domain-containing protein n=1 Tax=marine sediment metagenome TaxID=412755 RepID=X1VZR3_9ZZZZ